MKVLHLLQSPHFSGAENVVCQIIGMFRDNQDIEMAYCSRDGQIREALSERNIKFYPMTKLKISEVKRVIKEYKPDVIHAHDMRASYIAALCCGKIPLISHIHNNSFGSRGISTKSIAYILAGIKAKHIFWVSKSAYDGYFFKKLFKKKSSVLQNIIDIDALYDKMQSDKNEYEYDIVYVGRLTYQKNPERLIDVFEKVCKINGNVKIAVIGTGDLEENVRALSHEKGLDDNIDFLGFRSNPLKIVYDSKVMIMTSRWEGTPMCALEAMCLGTPIVSTPVDGLKDIIVNDVNGYLCDDNETLADKIVSYINSPIKLQQMSDEQIALSLKWNNNETYKQKLLKIYKD